MGVDAALARNDVAATGAAGLSDFGLRVSRLLRFCDLAMLASLLVLPIEMKSPAPRKGTGLECYGQEQRALRSNAFCSS
jgi:hypothetical protein